jgi:hypothetical protein
MLLVVAVVVFHKTLGVRITTGLVLEDSKEVVSSANQVHRTRRFRVLLLALGAFLLLVDAVLLQEKFVGQSEFRVVPNLHPGTIAVTRNAHAYHPRVRPKDRSSSLA